MLLNDVVKRLPSPLKGALPRAWLASCACHDSHLHLLFDVLAAIWGSSAGHPEAENAPLRCAAAAFCSRSIRGSSNKSASGTCPNLADLEGGGGHFTNQRKP